MSHPNDVGVSRHTGSLLSAYILLPDLLQVSSRDAQRNGCDGVLL